MLKNLTIGFFWGGGEIYGSLTRTRPISERHTQRNIFLNLVYPNQINWKIEIIIQILFGLTRFRKDILYARWIQSPSFYLTIFFWRFSVDVFPLTFFFDVFFLTFFSWRFSLVLFFYSDVFLLTFFFHVFRLINSCI